MFWGSMRLKGPPRLLGQVDPKVDSLGRVILISGQVDQKSKTLKVVNLTTFAFRLRRANPLKSFGKDR